MTTRDDQTEIVAPQDGVRVARVMFWVALAAMILTWTYAVYLPDRRKLSEAREVRASLLKDVSALATEVNSMTMSEQLLAEGAPYLWDHYRRVRLNWTAPGENVIDKDSRIP